MKILRIIFAVILVSTMAIIAAGCSTASAGNESKANETKSETKVAETASQPESTSSTTQPTETQNPFVIINGTEVRIGMKFDEVQKYLECDMNSPLQSCIGNRSMVINHQKTGLGFNILEDKDTGRIIQIIVDSDFGDTSSIILGGKIKIGDSADAVKEAFGNPTTEDETAISYKEDKNNFVFIFSDNKIKTCMIDGLA